MEHVKPSQPEEQLDRPEEQGPGGQDDGRGGLDGAAIEVLEEELERARHAARQKHEEPTCVVGPPPALPARPAEPVPLSRGTGVGRYLVLERLGSGGMGEVYAALDPQLNRRVALKLLLPGGVAEDPAQARTRLMREAQAMARLSHPHVLPVYDIGEHGDRVFIALELVEGSTLRQWLKERSRTWREVVAVLCQAGEGLAAAHAVGLVHRDFKPDNVMVGRDGRVLVYDFGLACEQGTGSSRAPVPVDLSRLLVVGETPRPDAESLSHVSTRDPLETPVTRAGLIMGTPGYMAPEQYRQEPLTGRADQFSFCATLHYALYGEHAFEGSGAAALARATLEGRLRTAPRGAEVPEWLRQVVLQGLSARPEERFLSMEALLTALQDEPRVGRGRQVLVAVATLFLGAVVAGALTQWHQEQSLCQEVGTRMEGVWDGARQQAVQRAFLATGQPYAADAWTGVKDALDGYASSWLAQQRQACEATRLRGEASEERLALRTACLERRRAEFKALTGLFLDVDAAGVAQAVEAVRGLPELGPCDRVDDLTPAVPLPRDVVKATRVDEGYAQLARAHALRLAGQFTSGLLVARALVADARVQNYAPLTAEALLELGRQQLAASDARAERTLREAVWTADEVGLDEVRAEALVTLTQLVAYDTARTPDGQDWYEQARALLSRTQRQGRLLAELESAHGLIYTAQGDPVAAEAAQRRALAELEKANALESPEAAMVLRRLGLTLSAQGRHAEALSENLRAHAAFLPLGAEHPRVGSALVSIGASLSALGRPTEALAALRQGVDIVTRALPPHHPFQAMALDALGLALWRDGQGEEARRVLRRAVDAAEHARGPEHPDTAQPCTSLGWVLMDQGRSAEALALFTRALHLRERALGPQHPELAGPLTGQGEALARLGRSAEALTPLERALQLSTAHLVPPEALAETRFALARALWDTHRESPRALELAGEAGQALETAGTEGLRTRVRTWLAERSRRE